MKTDFKAFVQNLVSRKSMKKQKKKTRCGRLREVTVCWQCPLHQIRNVTFWPCFCFVQDLAHCVSVLEPKCVGRIKSQTIKCKASGEKQKNNVSRQGYAMLIYTRFPCCFFRKRSVIEILKRKYLDTAPKKHLHVNRHSSFAFIYFTNVFTDLDPLEVSWN